MTSSSQTIMERAEARFLDLQKRKADRTKAASDYQSEARARDIKTAKLRALRLAKEEADRAAEALKVAAEPVKKRASRAATSRKLPPRP